MPGWTISAGVRDVARLAKVAKLVDALALGASGATRGSSSLPFRTSHYDPFINLQEN